MVNGKYAEQACESEMHFLVELLLSSGIQNCLKEIKPENGQ